MRREVFLAGKELDVSRIVLVLRVRLEALFMCWPSNVLLFVVAGPAHLHDLFLLLIRPVARPFAFEYKALLVLPRLPDRSAVPLDVLLDIDVADANDGS